MKKQRGVTLSGFIFVAVVLIFVLLLGFKLFKPYTEYFAIQKTFKELSLNPEVKNGSRQDAMNAWAPRSLIENITAISGDDIEINKEGNEVTLSAAYTVKVPLFKNISLVIDFTPSSK
jgi:hypothetical protein